MTPPSQYRRPAAPPALHMQPRDHAILRSVARYGHLTTDHVSALHFRGRRSPRAAQHRLRLLWAHGLVDRIFLPLLLTGTNGPVRVKPVYRLGPGAAALRESWRPARRGALHLPHDLMAVDLLVAAVAATRGRATAIPESQLWQRLREYRARTGDTSTLIAPDGMLTVGTGRDAMGIPIEIVRADPRGGIANLERKLRRYATLVHRGVVQHMLGVQRVRCLLVVLPTTARAENLRRRVASLPHGRQLVWIGVAPRSGSRTSPPQTFTARAVLDCPWQDGDGTKRTLRDVLGDGASGDSGSTAL